MNLLFKESVVFKVMLCHSPALHGLDVLGEHPQVTVTVSHHPAVVTGGLLLQEACGSPLRAVLAGP